MRIRGLTSFFRSVVALLSCIGTRAFGVSSIREETIRLVLHVRSYSVVTSAVWFFEVPRMPKSICRLQNSYPGSPTSDDCRSFLRLTCQADLKTRKPSLILFRSLVVLQFPIDVSICPPPCSGTVNSPASQRIPSRTTFSLIQPG